MEVSSRQLERIFKKLEVRERRSTHHVAGIVFVDGHAQIPVHYSHGRKGLAGHPAHMFRKSLLLRANEFETLKRCKMTRHEYLRIASERLNPGV